MSEPKLNRNVAVRFSAAEAKALQDELDRMRRASIEAGVPTDRLTLSSVVRHLVRRGLADRDEVTR